MSSQCVEIRRLNNGFVVEATDPKIVEANDKQKSGVYRYRNPRREYAFKTFKEVLKWLKDNEATLTAAPKDDYGTAFDEPTEA
jgi:hypothetical protein